MTVWTDGLKAELSNLFHLAATALAGQRPTRYDRRLWASARFHEAHPEISETAAYKQLDHADAWRY